MKRLSLALALFALLAIGCGRQVSYLESFDSAGAWRIGSDDFAEGQVADGVYDLLVKWDSHISWTAAGQSFGDGIYEVEATQVEGPVDNGYGMIFRADDESGDFYVFLVSGDGFIWIGRYRDGGDTEAEPLVGQWWFESAAVEQGLNQTNRLRVRAESGNMVFYVNGREVGRVTDNAFSRGDIGLVVRTLGAGGVRVHFDNFSVSPIEN